MVVRRARVAPAAILVFASVILEGDVSFRGDPDGRGVAGGVGPAGVGGADVRMGMERPRRRSRYGIGGGIARAEVMRAV
jgi:hypothetical protein